MPYPVCLFKKSTHDRRAFDCGEPSLDDYLKRYLSQDLAKFLGGAYVMLDGTRVIGYYTLQSTSVDSSHYTDETKKSVKYQSIPAFLIGRLALDRHYRDRRLGEYLLQDALERCLLLSQLSGGHYVLVDALHNKAKEFYQKYAFTEVSKNSFRLLMPMSDIKKKSENRKSSN